MRTQAFIEATARVARQLAGGHSGARPLRNIPALEQPAAPTKQQQEGVPGKLSVSCRGLLDLNGDDNDEDHCPTIDADKSAAIPGGSSTLAPLRSTVAMPIDADKEVAPGGS
jgi:hypothetical protein